jgi:hypothetical protein
MERLGHSSIQVTLGTYGHLFPALDEALTERLGETISAARRAPNGGTSRQRGARMGHAGEGKEFPSGRDSR